MFNVERARSNNTPVEYVRVDLEEVVKFILENKSHDIKEYSHEKDLVSCCSFPLSPKAEIIIRKFETKKSKKFKGFSVSLNHVAWISNEGEPITWLSGSQYDQQVNFQKSWNTNQFLKSNINQSNKHILYIVFDGGFSKDVMYENPYFISEEAFEYIYKREDEM